MPHLRLKLGLLESQERPLHTSDEDKEFRVQGLGFRIKASRKIECGDIAGTIIRPVFTS